MTGNDRKRPEMTCTKNNEIFTHFQTLILLFAAAIAYECYECQYKGKDPENLCLQPSEDSGKVSIESISQLRGL